MNEIMKCSSASEYDYIALTAHIKYIYTGNKCDEQINYMSKRFAKTKNLQERIESYKKAKGCGYVLNRTVDRIGNIRFKTCICSIKHPLTNRLLYLSDLLDKGILPFRGCAMEQPAQIMELLEVVSNAKIHAQNAQNDEKKGGK